jgi:small subunit ribosomal protein S3
MKGEVYGKRDLSPLAGMDKKQLGKGGDSQEVKL